MADDQNDQPMSPSPWLVDATRNIFAVVNSIVGGGGPVNTTPYPTVTPDMLLNTYSHQGYRKAKLQTKPAWIREVHGYKENWRQGDQSSVRVFDVPCSGRKLAVDYWLGYSEVSSENGKLTLSRTLPEQHPKYPWLWACEAELVEGLGAIIQDPDCKDAEGNDIPMIFYAESTANGFKEGPMRYAVTYRPLLYELLNDIEVDAVTPFVGELCRYVDRQTTYAVQAQPIPSTIQFKFLNDGITPTSPTDFTNTTIPGTPQFIMPTKGLTYRWVDVPEVPHEAIDNCVGKVNSEPFDGAPGWKIYNPETLLCHAPITKRYRSVTGRVTWEIIYRFDYRPNGWNNFLAADRGFYKAGINGDSSKLLYQKADFFDLFRIEQAVNP